MSTEALVAFIMSLLGGLGMLARGRLMYDFFSRRMGGWGGHHHHLLWERTIAGHFGLWWPWMSVLAGSIVVISTITFYLAPRYRRSLGATILAVSLINLFFGVGTMFASFLGIVGGIIAVRSALVAQNR